MKCAYTSFAVFALIALSSCGREVNPTVEKKPIAAVAVAPKVVSDPTPEPTPPTANDDDEYAKRIKENRKIAEEFEAKARQLSPDIGKSYTDSMMFVALAWLKAQDKTKALAAAKAAIAAGPDDRSPGQTCLWHYNIGEVLLQCGEIPLATEHFEASLKSAPDALNATRARKKLGDLK